MIRARANLADREAGARILVPDVRSSSRARAWMRNGARPRSALMSEPTVLLEGISFGEQPRWHEARLWFSDWGPPEIVAVDLDGTAEVMLQARSFPCCVDWLPDGRLLLVSAGEGQLLRQEPDGSLVPHGDLATASDPPAGNELVVDGRGNAYVNGGGFDLSA